MPGYDLEFLIQRLQSAFEGGRRKVHARQEGHLERIIDCGKDGVPQSITYACRLPALKGKEHTYELIRVPYWALQSQEIMTISELRVEFDCEVQLSPAKKPAASAQIFVVPETKKANRRAGTHRARIVLCDTDGGEAQVSIDGAVLEKDAGDRLVLPDEIAMQVQKEKQTAFRFFQEHRFFLIVLMILVLAVAVWLLVG